MKRSTYCSILGLFCVGMIMLAQTANARTCTDNVWERAQAHPKGSRGYEVDWPVYWMSSGLSGAGSYQIEARYVCLKNRVLYTINPVLVCRDVNDREVCEEKILQTNQCRMNYLNQESCLTTEFKVPAARYGEEKPYLHYCTRSFTVPMCP